MGANRIAAVHRDDAARAFRLAAEAGGAPGSLVAYQAVAEEGLPHAEVASAIGAAAGVPVERVTRLGALRRLGPYGAFIASDRPADSSLTRRELCWEPNGPGLLEDLAGPSYSSDASS